MSNAPRDVVSARGALRKRSRSVFEEIPNGSPRSEDELAAIVHCSVIGSQEETTAGKVQLVILGLSTFTLPNDDRALLLETAVARRLLPDVVPLLEAEVSSRGLPVTEVDVVDGRVVRSSWTKVVRDREEIRVAGEALLRDLEPLLPDEPDKLRPDPHQLEAVVRMERAGWRFLLEDDMGLGKTPMALCGILRHPDPWPVLVACPASMCGTWQIEARRWLAKLDPTVVILDKSVKVATLPRRSFVIGSWSQIQLMQHEIRELDPRAFVADESHYIANFESGRTRAALRVRRPAALRLAMSGTSEPNGRHRELYAQLLFLRDDLESLMPPPTLEDREFDRPLFTRFAERYCGPSFSRVPIKGGKTKTVRTYDGRSNDVELARIKSPFSLRRTKRQVGLSLPEKTLYAVECPLSPAERIALAGVKDEVRARLLQRAERLRAEYLERGERPGFAEDACRKLLASQAMTELTETRQRLGVIKAKFSRTLVEELVSEGHRVVVFAEHHAVHAEAAKIYRGLFGEDRVLVGTGSDVGKVRTDIVNDFERRGRGDVLVLTSAYREGVTLTAADRLVMLQRWWVPGWEAQAVDRIHRRGQTKSCAAYFLVSSGTVDDAMGELVTWKERGQQDMAGSAEMRVFRWLGVEREVAEAFAA
jgi:hypothetical protein